MSATASTATQPKPLEWLNRLRANPRIPLIVAGSAAVAIVVAMVLWAKTPDYRTLFSNLSDQDGGAIVAQLTQMNIPYRFANGLINLPLNHELSDRQIVTVQQKSADSWGESMRDAFDWLSAESAREGGGRMLPIHLTPYIMGLPYRIEALEALLADFAAREQTWFARGCDIVSSWETQQ